MLSNRGLSRSESCSQQIDVDDWDEQSILSTRVAFSASHLCEEIEGATLHEEKHHKEKTKTGAGALVVCLNIDIDPPDVHKIPPYSRVEAWFDPTDANSLRALETIGKNLQAQYDRWQPRARFKQCLDPTLDDVKNLCLNLRRNLKSDRILFHYNGHGVPRPTENGEIWVFNTKFTKYIPLSLYDLQRWLGAPSVYVIDCQNAGRVIRMYEKFCQRRMAEAAVAAQRQHHDVPSDSRGLPNGAAEVVAGAPNESRKSGGVPLPAAGTAQPDLSAPHGQSGGPPLGHIPPVSMENTIMLAACRFLDETLLDRIPGAHSNRMSLLGEINWIFTAVTDTIAWCSFPIDVFQKLFRQDLLVAGLFRNYLLAERIMKTYGCTPVSAPTLPPTFRHSMWDAWDHVLDRLVHYLPRMLKLMEGSPVVEPKLPIILPKNSNQLNSHGGIQSQTISSQLISPLPVTASDQAVETAICHRIPQLGRATTTTATAAAVVAATAAAAVNCGQPNTRVTSTSKSNVQTGAFPINEAPGHLIQQQHRPLVSSRQPTSSNQPNTNWPLKHNVLPQVPARPDFQSNKKVVNFTDLPPPGFRQQQEPVLAQSKLVPLEAEAKSPPHRPIPRHVDALDRLLQEDCIEKRVPSAGGMNHSNIHASSSLPPSPTSLTRNTKKQSSNQYVAFVEGADIRTTNLPPVKNVIVEAATNTGTIDRSLSGASHHDKSKLVADRQTEQTEQPSKTDDALNAPPSQVVTNTSTITTTNAQVDTHAPSEHTMTALRRQRPVIHKLYTFQSRNEQPQQLRTTVVAPVIGNEPVKANVLRSGFHGAYPNRPNFYVPPTGLQAVRINPPTGAPLPSTGMAPGHDIRATPAPQTTTVGQPTTPASEPPVYAGSVIGGSGLASFFTSQMSAFKVWLQTTDEKRPPAMQLPILLQILLSQSHRTRAMQLLSEFLDLGPWAVTHCLMVGILPYIVRLFSSNLFEVKPHLVFIWGKIIASAQTEFSRNDSVRDVGYKYFLNCLSDTENLSLLTRTITAFALTKMLEKEPNGEPDSFFQEVSLKQNFIPLVLSQLADNPPDLEQETLVRLRLWLIFALSKLWRKNDEARWFGIRYNVTEVLYAYLDDICPEVRAATVCALGTLVDNQTMDASKQDHASQIGLQVCTHLVKLATLEASPLVRRELIAALCGLVRQFDTQLCAVAFCYLLELQQALQNQPIQTPSLFPTSGGTSNRQTPDSWSSVCRSAHNRENGLVESHLLRTPTAPSSAVHSPKFLKRPDYFNPAHTIFASTTNIYFQFWLALVHLSNDPYPDVAEAARVVVRYLLDKFDIPATASSSPSSNETATEPNACQARSPQLANPASIVTSSPPTDPLPTSTAFRTPEVVVPNTPLARAVHPQVASPPRASTQLIPGSGPAHTQTPGSPRGSQAQVMCQSFSSCSPVNACSYLNQRRPARPGVALTSTFLIHSAQFPGRRHQQADQVIRKPLLNAQTMHPPLVRTPVVSGDNNESDNSQSVLNEVQRTQFFAWSCRWFTRPLLVKYGGTSMKETRSPVTYSSNTTPTSPADAIFKKPSFSFGLSDKSLHPSHRPTSPDPELAALCAVSVDSNAVAYADRLSRLTSLRHTLRSGRLRWLEALSGNHVRTQARSSADVLPTDDTTQVRLMSQLACHRLDNEPGPIRIHPYQPHLVVGDRCGVSVQSSKTLESLNRLPTTPDVDLFSSFTDQSQSVHYPQGASSRVTDLQFINCCEERCLLLCAHEDGRVRVWRNYLRDLGQDPEIVTAWTGLSELIPSSQPAGLVVHWSQSTSQLALGGDSRLIRLWDCEREARLRDVPTGADACVTVLDRSADQRLLCAGFGDGGVRVFDLRAPASSTTTSVQHGDWPIPVGFMQSSLVSVVACMPPAQPGPYLPGNGPIPALARPNSPVVDLSSTSSHFLVAGVGGPTCQLLLHRIQDGTVHSVYRPVCFSGRESLGIPISVAIHPAEPLIVAGLKDKSLLLINTEASRGSRA
ncbi:hypothetical protein EG68_02896 [Paragonimus skrjabini miyazakii]|uniref:Raptor N-terminal CASPase-like domain-containing protein n=1 Tax=Paragonimus skrjabini miyazakii TaxID=59628 RepID=A0A8S9Z1Q4_9TREM|nr:hypothetical protein EG68_02896 [Paragonimus skrjabini miyazakii]